MHRGTGSNIIKKKYLQEVLSRSRGSGLSRYTVKRRSRNSDCNVSTQVTTPEESHPPEQEVRIQATARDRSRATVHDRSRARAHDRYRPHKVIDHTKEGFEATRGEFESTRSIQSYRHWKQEGVQFEKWAQFKTDRSRIYDDQCTSRKSKSITNW